VVVDGPLALVDAPVGGVRSWPASFGLAVLGSLEAADAEGDEGCDVVLGEDAVRLGGDWLLRRFRPLIPVDAGR
jgi:hypothetical protein